ncbi:AAA family ATPase [Sinorhizobium medicae]|nr:AAA family ATPase [Sinorhizobium meliloti]MDX1066446.1 AAA family ATPase [Sinorhizobium medicae]
MPNAASAFSFDENADSETNFDGFGTHLAQCDADLGAELPKHFPKLRTDTFSQQEIWNALFATVKPVENAAVKPGAEPPTGAASVNPSVTDAPTGHNAVAGWLLEGVSIEGFRGINNEGKPLELKFHPDKINSISAVNGVGKSSVYDAIRYAISGRLEWLDDLPATERDGDYYLNRFNTSQKATIKLRLVAEPTGQKCEIVVTRDANGNRSVVATPPWDAETVLRSLDREFVLLDGPTFLNFIAARPLDRGRTFSGLLGLSDYNTMRQSLAALANTRAFGNHFDTNAHAQGRAREAKVAKDAHYAIGRDYAILTGAAQLPAKASEAVDKCHSALVQIGPLTELCKGLTFAEIDIDSCLDAIKAAEGGPKRERLAACIRERENLTKLYGQAPLAERVEKLVELAAAREESASKTAGEVMLQLFQAGAKVLELPEWQNADHCPLCDNKMPHNLQEHVANRLADFSALDAATQAIALEWNEAGWADLNSLEALLEPSADARLIAKCQQAAQGGKISSDGAKRLVAWLQELQARAQKHEQDLATEQQALEKELPQSSVEVTKKVEAARRLQESWRKLADAFRLMKVEDAREAAVSRIKTFLDKASADFAQAEAEVSKARLAAVEPVFKSYFANMSFLGVVPAVSKRASSEDLQIRLSEFHGLTNLSPQALLSESFRNAFAISLYLAAASLYGGMPKFIVLDDVTSSFDAGHQYFLVELLRTTFARPGNPAGLQVILLSHDTMLEKLFNKHSNSGAWWHQRLEGVPQLAVLPQAGAVNKVRDQTIAMLQAGQVDFAKEGVRQYLEYRLGDLISRLRIPVPVDVAFNENKQLASEFLGAIDAAVILNQAANRLVLEPAQIAGLNTNMATIVGNFLSHWGTGQTLSFTGAALLGVMQAIDNYCECFTFEPAPGAPRAFYKSLQQRQ